MNSSFLFRFSEQGEEFFYFRRVPVDVSHRERHQQASSDELVFLDITAHIENRRTLLNLVAKVAEVIHIPFIVGGGIRDMDDIRRSLRAGADKVSIGSAALLDPILVQRAPQEFGAQCIVISVDAKKGDRGWKVLTLRRFFATGSTRLPRRPAKNPPKWSSPPRTVYPGESLKKG